jgi:hypothetical protein
MEQAHGSCHAQEQATGSGTISALSESGKNQGLAPY